MREHLWVWAAGHAQQAAVTILLRHGANAIDLNPGRCSLAIVAGMQTTNLCPLTIAKNTRLLQRFEEAANAFYEGVTIDPEKVVAYLTSLKIVALAHCENGNASNCVLSRLRRLPLTGFSPGWGRRTGLWSGTAPMTSNYDNRQRGITTIPETLGKVDIFSIAASFLTNRIPRFKS
ncbi:unnamed protein product [Vicia faba]|uniref:Uncharacterized protein n=1 Tax=Vicia faba TaxID=3906 RepID=A0AAV1B1X8_VICFA|nr:unnamed protein product [Vicia faba]